MELPTPPPPAPPDTKARRLLAFAYLTWWVPLYFATLILLAFLITDSLTFAGLGLLLVVIGGIAALAGIIATLVVLTGNKTPASQEIDPLQHKAYIALGLLLSNFAVAGVYAIVGLVQIDTSIATRAPSPTGEYIAELALLDESDTPPYGQAVSLRPAGNPFKFAVRRTVYRGYCSSVPVLTWIDTHHLVIHCVNPEQVSVRATAYRDISIQLQEEIPPPPKPVVRNGRKPKPRDLRIPAKDRDAD
jgi:hypothetical protein